MRATKSTNVDWDRLGEALPERRRRQHRQSDRNSGGVLPVVQRTSVQGLRRLRDVRLGREGVTNLVQGLDGQGLAESLDRKSVV